MDRILDLPLIVLVVVGFAGILGAAVIAAGFSREPVRRIDVLIGSSLGLAIWLIFWEQAEGLLYWVGIAFVALSAFAMFFGDRVMDLIERKDSPDSD